MEGDRGSDFKNDSDMLCTVIVSIKTVPVKQQEKQSKALPMVVLMVV